MRAAVGQRYGTPDVIDIAFVPEPECGPHDVVVAVAAAAVTTADSAARRGTPVFARLAFGLRRRRARTLGTEFAGLVVEVGSDVTRLGPGDRVWAATGAAFGAHAERVVLSETAAIAIAPVGTPWAEAVALAEGGLTALPFLRDHGQIRSGDRVLITGASGAVGSVAVQLARHFGASVTAVCSAANAHFVRDLGADHIVDRNRVDFTTRLVEGNAVGARYDVIFDAAGSTSYSRCAHLLTENGRYLTTVPRLGAFVRMALTSRRRGRRTILAFTGLRSPQARALDLDVLRALAQSGAVRGCVDSTFPFERVSDAHARVDTRLKRGSVVLRIDASLVPAGRGD